MNCCTYLLPIRRSVFSEAEAQDFVTYFESLRAADCELIVVDGSPPEVFQQHHAAWSQLARHEVVDRRFGYMNDKVNGIHTGVELATCEKIILADDDIRYTAADLEKCAACSRNTKWCGRRITSRRCRGGRAWSQRGC
jgi:hypothetical protein